MSKELDENTSSTKTLFAPNIMNLRAHATLNPRSEPVLIFYSKLVISFQKITIANNPLTLTGYGEPALTLIPSPA